jgi:hypothetical protein
MPLTNFTNLDFDQIKTTLKDYLKSNSNFTDYDFEGSNLSTILDVLSYNTYICSYNANMVANEVFIDSATLRENVVALARNIGYVPKSKKSARTTINFFIDASGITPTPSSMVLKKGIVASTSSRFGSQSYTFCINSDITVPVVDSIASFNNIKIYEGTYISQSFTYSDRNPNQRFILPNSGIDTETIQVSVRPSELSSVSVKYSLKENLFDISEESEVYFLQEIEDERYEIIFGDGKFGRKIQDGEIIDVSYILTNGDSANGISDFTFSGRIIYNRNGVDYTVSSGISLITPDGVASGGEQIESVDSIKKYAPRIYASQNRALTASDYETLIPSRIYPETESISVFGGEDLIPPQYGKVFISIKPKYGDFLSNLVKENIKRDLKQYAVAGIVPEILDLKYLYVEVDSKVYYNTNFAPNSEYVSSIVQYNAKKYAESSELNTYGAKFKYSKFLNIIDKSHNSVTSNITTVQMRRDLRLSIDNLSEYSIQFGNKIHIQSMNGYNIKTSSFRVQGIDQDLYFSDLPNSNKKTGKIFLFSLPNISSTSPTIIKDNVGKIDYENSIITLNPIKIISGKIKNGRPIIEISAIPVSNDVIGKQDLYLQLDINNSLFELIADEISSGLNPSGSTFEPSSSYKNGNLVRL